MVAPWAALIIASGLAALALARNQPQTRRLDWLYFCATFPFAVLALLDLLGGAGRLGEPAWFTGSRLAYQCMILGVSALVLALLHDRHGLRRSLLGVQAALGVFLAFQPLRQPAGWPLPPWESVNLAISFVFVAMLAWVLLRRGGGRAWLVLIALIPGLGVMVADFGHGAGQPLRVSWPQLFYAPVVALLWLLSTRRVKFRSASEEAADAPPAPSQQASLAQDLHDGVGGHLTSIIASLDTHSARERVLAWHLQECLVELKLLVDGTEENRTLTALLASLRHRVTPLLATAGVTMEWELSHCAALDRIDDSRARHILRIAQEALSNALQHSGASRVRLTCACLEHERSVLLEVVDDGVGWSPPEDAVSAGAPSAGKGVRGMRERARELGGRLTIGPAAGSGTRVALLAPWRDHAVVDHPG